MDPKLMRLECGFWGYKWFAKYIEALMYFGAEKKTFKYSSISVYLWNISCVALAFQGICF